PQISSTGMCTKRFSSLNSVHIHVRKKWMKKTLDFALRGLPGASRPKDIERDTHQSMRDRISRNRRSQGRRGGCRDRGLAARVEDPNRGPQGSWGGPESVAFGPSRTVV